MSVCLSIYLSVYLFIFLFMCNLYKYPWYRIRLHWFKIRNQVFICSTVQCSSVGSVLDLFNKLFGIRLNVGKNALTKQLLNLLYILSCHKNYFLVFTSEILNTAHLTPFFDNTISIEYSLPANTNTNGYCVLKTRF